MQTWVRQNYLSIAILISFHHIICIWTIVCLNITNANRTIPNMHIILVFTVWHTKALWASQLFASTSRKYITTHLLLICFTCIRNFTYWHIYIISFISDFKSLRAVKSEEENDKLWNNCEIVFHNDQPIPMNNHMLVQLLH